MSLISLQREFRDALLAEDGGTTSPGLGVYHNAYRAQLRDCLREAFPQTRKWLGDDEFTECALAHISSTPPHGWTLGIYGEGFDATLAAFYPGDPEVRELAWLEWSLSCAFTGPDSTSPDADALASIDWDHATLIFVPTLSLGELRTNSTAIWSALAADESPPAVAPLPHIATALVWRQGFVPTFRTIDRDERDALAAVLGGATFGMICNAAVARLGAEKGVEQAGLLLGQWLGDGMIAAIRSDHARPSALSTPPWSK